MDGRREGVRWCGWEEEGSDFSFSRHNNNGSYLSDRWACHFWRAVGGLCTCRVFTTEKEHRSVAKTLILVQHNKVDG